jgi:hypothetical protein
MKQFLIIIGIIFLAAQCPECPTHDPTICDSINVIDTIYCDTLKPECPTCPDCPPCDTCNYDPYQQTIDALYNEVNRLNVLLAEKPDTVFIPCPEDSIPEEPPVTDILFESDFEPPVSISLTGNAGEPYKINGWEKLFAIPGVTTVIFNMEGPPLTDVAIKTDPMNPSNHCLYGEITGSNRFQSSWRFDQDFESYHFSYDIFLSPTMEVLKNYPSDIYWFTLIELWETHNASLDGDGSGQARWNLGIFKASNSDKLYWDLHMELMQPASVRFDTVWTASNHTYPIPFGRWAHLDFLMVRGQPGKIVIKIDGTEIFNETRYTEYPGSPLPIWRLNMWKLYTELGIVNFVNNNGGKIYAYYDNFKWLK